MDGIQPLSAEGRRSSCPDRNEGSSAGVGMGEIAGQAFVAFGEFLLGPGAGGGGLRAGLSAQGRERAFGAVDLVRGGADGAVGGVAGL